MIFSLITPLNCHSFMLFYYTKFSDIENYLKFTSFLLKAAHLIYEYAQ